MQYIMWEFFLADAKSNGYTVQGGHTQLHVKFPVCNFPGVFLRAKMNIFYFVNGLHHLLKHNLTQKLFIFPALSKYPKNNSCVFPFLEKNVTWFDVANIFYFSLIL